MIVVDGSAAIALSLGLVDETVYVTDELAAPHLIDCEVLNGLGNQIRSRGLTEEQATAALAVFGALEIERFAVDWLRARMWDLRNKLTAYDAAYVALTEAVDADHFLTADAKMANAPGVNCSITLIS